MMRINQASAFALAGAAIASALPAQDQAGSDVPSCRFALEWSQEEVLTNPDGFINDLLYWEGRFHQNNVSYNTGNGMSYDGTQLDWETGQRTDKHTFSAPSKEVSKMRLNYVLYNFADSDWNIGPPDHALHPRHRRLAASCTVLDSRESRGCSGLRGFHSRAETPGLYPVQ